MELQEQLDADVRPRGVTGQTLYAPSVLGSSLQYTEVNSLAPFGNLVTTSTGEAPEPFALGRTRRGGFRGRIFIGGEVILGAEEPQEFVGVQARPRVVQIRRSRIDLDAGVETYARAAGALEDVSVVGELCLRLVPKARRVLVTLTHDPEERTTGLCFCVWTSAMITEIVTSEDALHDALFDRIPVVRRPSYSIRYEFVRG